MDADYLHLIVNHIPIFSMLFGLLILGWGLFKHNLPIQQMALVLFLLAAVSSYIALETGEAAEDIVEELGVASSQVIHDHEEAAEIAFWFSVVTGLLSLAGLFALSHNLRWKNTLLSILAIAAILSLGTLLFTAYQGGKIYHGDAAAQGTVEQFNNNQADIAELALSYYS
ncbi:hypothetical protein [Fodinibius sediminis]|uniref:DUF2231 domain-containing protein n=1 Tax=Fodinibius sediminis TaxID=1214077 RepID=A0A521BK49_9BACT|nr:hypothetical protein [Fodinibius sediminis]SMO47446.1 hypothetical protein SAMN06265218_103174 [Fodinibius sediminis]